MTKEDFKIDEEALQALADNILKMAESIVDISFRIIELAATVFANNKRVVHLAVYGSSQRIRKKNVSRLCKIAERWLKND